MTVQDIIDAALRRIGALDPGETPTQTERSNCLETLNAMIGSWSAQGAPIYQIYNETFSLSGMSVYTIGVGQTFNTTRPVKIQAAATIFSGHKEPCKIVTADEWAQLNDQSLTGYWAKVLYYDGGHPYGQIRLWPRPQAGSQLELASLKPLPEFSQLSDTVDLPPGYEMALTAGLAVQIAPEFGRVVDDVMAALARDAMTSVIGLNVAVLGGTTSQVQGAKSAVQES